MTNINIHDIGKRFPGEARAASMLLVTPQLMRPEDLLEIEIIAAGQ
jgi:hypothetical protein